MYNNAYTQKIKLPDQWIDFLAQHKFVWFGHRAMDIVGLDDLLHFGLIICCDYGLDTDSIIKKNGANLVSLERETRVRENWTHASLAKLFSERMFPLVSDKLIREGADINILAYTSTKEIETIARERAMHILAMPSSIKRALDNKIQLRKILPNIGIEPTPWHEARLLSEKFIEVKNKYGCPFVVQLSVGAGGFQTFFVSTEEGLERLKSIHGDEVVIVSQYIEGVSPNINAVVLDNTVLLSYPSLQLIGAKECTHLPAGYCGNDFSATSHLSEPVIQKIYFQTRVIGEWLRQQGFRGLFGIDFVTDGTTVYPVELNPRFQGSTQLLTLTQIMQHQIPLTLAHILGMLENINRVSLEKHFSLYEHPCPLLGAQIILHNQNPASTIVRGLVQPGIYTIKGDKIIYLRPGISLADCRGPNEFIITCAVPVLGTCVEPMSPLLKIQTHRQILDIHTGALQTWASVICRWAYNSLSLS